ncbi:unnamed protein product [Cuscuta epithymum]|uniref:Retrotransposon Copia-like N-terminal domain-containing protein n=1 Tax=Cuscuta epithymum TaxID=186058 RepID=A0AAV0D5B9_9ASTE|nr:unnamed protein product [Cuscuta epithymum]
MTITESTSVISITAATHFLIKLTTSNFPVWKCQVYNALVGLGLDSYINGTLPSPNQFNDSAKTQPNPCYMIWYRQDKTIISVLLGSCSKTIQPLLSSAATARQAWEKLTLTYASTSQGRIISLKTTLARTMRGARSITEYLTKMFALSESLTLAQSPQSEEDLVINILRGLGPEYNDITFAIRVRETVLPLTALQDILLEQEIKLRDQATVTTELLPTAHVTHVPERVQASRERRSYSGNERRSQQPRRGRGGFYGTPRPSTNPIICRFCDHMGHDVKNCRKLQRFLRDNHVSYAPPAVNHTTGSASPGQPWLFDSGASHHVASDASTLPSNTDYGGPDEVHLGNGSSHGGATNAGDEH